MSSIYTKTNNSLLHFFIAIDGMKLNKEQITRLLLSPLVIDKDIENCGSSDMESLLECCLHLTNR